MLYMEAQRSKHFLKLICNIASVFFLPREKVRKPILQPVHVHDSSQALYSETSVNPVMWYGSTCSFFWRQRHRYGQYRGLSLP